VIGRILKTKLASLGSPLYLCVASLSSAFWFSAFIKATFQHLSSKADLFTKAFYYFQ